MYHAWPLPSLKSHSDLFLEFRIPLRPLFTLTFHLKSICVILVTVFVRLTRKSSRLSNTWIPHELLIPRKQAAFQNEHTSSLSSPQCFHFLQNYTLQPKESFKSVARICSYREAVFSKKEKEKIYLGRVRNLSLKKKKIRNKRRENETKPN